MTDGQNLPENAGISPSGFEPAETKGRWADWEKDYLFKNVAVKTDAEIAAELGRPTAGVTEMRRKLGLKKNKRYESPMDVTKALESHAKIKETTAVEDMDDAQKRRFWLNELKRSAIWADCIQMFEVDELEVYQQKYIEYMMALESINEIEKNTIHLIICSIIRINRYHKLEKEYRELARGGDAEAGAKALSMNREIKDMTDVFMRASDDLNASRKQRIKDEGETKYTLVELIKELDKREAREKLGKEADAFSYIQQLEKKRLSEHGYLRGE